MSDEGFKLSTYLLCLSVAVGRTARQRTVFLCSISLGYFSIGLGTTVDEAVGDDFYDSETGEALDGFMADSEMAFKMAEAGFDMTDAKLDGEPCEEFNL